MRIKVAFIVLLSLLVVGAVSCQGDRSVDPPIHFNPNMDNQKRVDPQEPESFFRDNRGMRLPVPGTVANGQLRTDDHMFRGLVNGTFSTTLPRGIKLTRSLLERGKERYTIYCTPCHDSAGTGNGIVFRRKAGLPKPANLHDARLTNVGIGYLFHVISTGQNAGFEATNMRPMRRMIPTRDRWAISAYIRVLQRSQYPSSK